MPYEFFPLLNYILSNASSLADVDEPWKKRIRGFQPNSSRRSHAELEASTNLDEGDSNEFGQLVHDLQRKVLESSLLKK
jgi:hypothetical protein